jgi:Spy/CpxP family protein refolding chaperone
MKKVIALLAGALLIGSVAMGQAAGPQGGGIQSTGGGQQQGPKGKQKGQRAPVALKLLRQLNLTPDQQTKIRELMKSFAQKREEMTKNEAGQNGAAQTGAAQNGAAKGNAGAKKAKGAAKANRKEVAELRKNFEEDLNKILTSEQQAKLKELMANAKKNGKGGKGLTGGGTTSGGTGTTTTGGGTGGTTTGKGGGGN